MSDIQLAVKEQAEKIKLRRRLRELEEQSNLNNKVEQFGFDRAILKDYAEHPIQVSVEAEVNSWQGKINTLVRQGKPKSQILKVIERATADIENNYREACKAEQVRLAGEAKELEDRFKREHETDLTALLEAQIKYGAMSVNQLKEKAEEYLQKQGEALAEVKSYEVDLVLSNLRKYRDKEADIKAALLEDQARDRLYDLPWLHTEQGQRIVHEAHLFSPKQGQVNVYIDGKPFQVVFRGEPDNPNMNDRGLLNIPSTYPNDMTTTEPARSTKE